MTMPEIKVKYVEKTNAQGKVENIRVAAMYMQVDFFKLMILSKELSIL